MPEIFTNLIGYVAAAVGTSLMLPQIIKSYRTKKTGDLSMAMVILYIINCSLWLVYGLLLFAIPLIIANGIALIISIVQLILKLKYNNS